MKDNLKREKDMALVFYILVMAINILEDLRMIKLMVLAMFSKIVATQLLEIVKKMY